MGKVTTISLKGASGRTYDFDVYPWGTQFKPLGAVYTVLKRNQVDYSILYIGQTGDLSERFDNHHKRFCFDQRGKSHLGIHLEPSEAKRLGIESDLLGRYSPPCND